MKKKIVLLLTICLAISVLSGCSPKNTETMEKARQALDEGDYENAAAYYGAATLRRSRKK